METEIKQDELSSMEECSLDGVTFPTTSILTNYSQRVVEHNVMDKDGAILESLGFNAIKFEIEAPFYSGVIPGRGESWNNLYPNVYNYVISRLQSRLTLKFNHPEFGEYDVKCTAFKTNLDPNIRNGVSVSFSLTVDSAKYQTTPTQSSSVLADAKNFDDKIYVVLPPVDPTIIKLTGFNSFFEAVSSIGNIADQASLLNMQVIGKIDNIIGVINRVVERYDDAMTLFGNTPDKLIETLLKLKNKNAVVNRFEKQPAAYTTITKMTMAQISTYLKTSISDLIDLNPGISKYSIVPKNTVIFYLKTPQFITPKTSNLNEFQSEL